MPSVHVDGKTVFYINSVLYFKKNSVDVLVLSHSDRKLGTDMQHCVEEITKNIPKLPLKPYQLQRPDFAG